MGRRQTAAATANSADDFEPDACRLRTAPALPPDPPLRVANGRVYGRMPVAEKIRLKTVYSETGCWEWVGRLNRRGYGVVDVVGHARLAHRVSYALVNGEIPVGLTLDHLCRNPRCINPSHLEPVPLAVNIRRGGRAAQTHCKRGHPLAGSNLRMRGGARRCADCDDLWNRSRKDPALRQALMGD